MRSNPISHHKHIRKTMLAIIYYIILAIACLAVLILSAIMVVVLRPFDPARRCIHELSRLLTRIFFCWPKWRKITRGVEKIDRKQPYVITINHTSMVDIPLLYRIPLNFRWVSKREVFWVPFMGPLLSIHGDIPIERGNPKKAMTKVSRLGKLWLSRGATVAIFPEGTRSKDGEIHNFKLGAFNLAKEAGVEILPVVMTGTNTSVKKNKMVNWGNRVAIRVLKPVSVEEIASMGTKELTLKVQERMVTALAELREDIKNEKK